MAGIVICALRFHAIESHLEHITVILLALGLINAAGFASKVDADTEVASLLRSVIRKPESSLETRCIAQPRT